MEYLGITIDVSTDPYEEYYPELVKDVPEDILRSLSTFADAMSTVNPKNTDVSSKAEE